MSEGVGACCAFPFRSLLLALVCAISATSPNDIAASGGATGDWPMWGGSPDRNMASAMKGLPAEWDVKAGKNVKWSTFLGSQSYGNPIVSGGMIFIGTNNQGLLDKSQPGDRGVLMAIREADGEFMWQQTHLKLKRDNDWPDQGLASSPYVDGNRLYYVSNRAVLWCLDTQGFRDGKNDGLVTDEALTGPHDADVIWSFDMMKELGTFPHNMANSSPVGWGDLVYVSTSNGNDESHEHVPSPKTPAIIAVNKATGKVVWQANFVEDRILHGQWSTPAVGKIGGVDQVVSAEGDGWVRAYEPATGKKLWEFDTNPKDSEYPATRNELVATPVIYRDRVYIGNGQDPEAGDGPGHFYAIDATKRGDITESGRIFHFDKIRRSISTAAIADGIVYIPSFAGYLHALDADTGKELWMHDLFSAIWGSALVADGRVYIGNEDGDVIILQAGKELKELAKIPMGSSIMSTVVPANNALYVLQRNRLWALTQK